MKFAPWEAPVGGQDLVKGNSTDNEVLTEPFDEDEESEPTQLTFSLESDLQTNLWANLEQLELGLKEIDGGHEQNRRDITARDKDGNVVVIELKAGKAMPDAIAQIAAYMGEAKSEFDEQELRVRGLLIAAEFHDKVYSAASVIPDLGLIEYRYNFTFEKVC